MHLSRNLCFLYRSAIPVAISSVHIIRAKDLRSSFAIQMQSVVDFRSRFCSYARGICEKAEKIPDQRGLHGCMFGCFHFYLQVYYSLEHKMNLCMRKSLFHDVKYALDP